MAYTTIDDPSAYFQAKGYAGNSVDNTAITNDGNSNLQPDLIWFARYDTPGDKFLLNSSRGVTKFLISSGTDAEGTSTSIVKSFDTNGFSVGTNSNSNSSSSNYVAWQWKANAGTTSTNTDGSINTTVQANTDAGFSIVGYTCPDPITNFTIGHGLGVTPDVIIVKTRDGSRNWGVYHKSLTAPAENRNLKLNLTNAEAAESTFWANTAPTSSVITIAQNASVNFQGHNYIAYCFAEKQGYSKFGKYVGNGNSLGDGPFVYTGFAPSFVIIKRTDAANDWIMHTYKLGTKASSAVEKGNVGNLNNAALRANSNSFVDDWGAIDMLSNGFKIRTDAASENTSGGSYIYMAFAENPFTTSTGIPTTAR